MIGVYLVTPKLSFETGKKREILIHVDVYIDPMLMIPLLCNSVVVSSEHPLASFEVNIAYTRH